MIVKIQRPVFPPDGPVLVYDQGRKFVTSIAPTPEILKAMAGDHKRYFEVERGEGNGIKIIRRVSDRAW